MIHFPRIVIIVIAAYLSIGNLYAQETGWYAGAAVGQSKVQIEESFWSDDSISSGILDTKGFNYQIYVGYGFNRYIALEGGYLKIADSTFKGVSDGVNTIWKAGDIKGFTRIDGFVLQGVGFIPSGISRLQFYLKGGLFFSNSRTVYHSTINDILRYPDDGITLIGNVGIQARMWHDWYFRSEALYTTVPLENRQNVGISDVTVGITHTIQ